MVTQEGAVYCTLVLSDNYLSGAVVLAHSLRDNGSQAKLVALYTPDTLQAATISELQTIYDVLIPVYRMTNHLPANLWLMDRPDLIATFTKIELWRQTQFERIVYIDSDVVSIRAPDELLELDVDFAAAPDVGWPDCFNSGVMVLRPNMQDYFALKALAERGISFDGADQGLLNMHFRDWHRLSFTYNCTPTANYQYIPAYRHFQSTISLIHFIGSQKPWNMPRQVAPFDSPYNQLLGRWWTVHDRHYYLSATEQIPLSSRPVTPQVHYTVEPVLATHVKSSPGTVPQQDFERTSSVTISENQLHQQLPRQEYIHHFLQPSAVQEPTPPPEFAHSSDHGNPQTQPQTLVEIERAPSPQLPPHEQTTFEAPRAEWDASREPPPLNSKPEGIALETKTYIMSDSHQLFQPPSSYPEAPKNMYYEVPATKPEPQKRTQIFPWETNAPKPTRVFPNDKDQLQSTSFPISTKEISRTSQSSQPTTQTSDTSLPSEAWDTYPRSNAWDEVPEIQKYIQSIQHVRKAQVQSLSGDQNQQKTSPPTSTQQPSSGSGSGRNPGLSISTRITDFPSEIERPSLPVTPAPIHRAPAIGSPDEFTTDELPAAKGVPSQEEWNPSVCLEQLQRRQNSVLSDSDSLAERLSRAIEDGRGKEESRGFGPDFI